MHIDSQILSQYFHSNYEPLRFINCFLFEYALITRAIFLTFLEIKEIHPRYIIIFQHSNNKLTQSFEYHRIKKKEMYSLIRIRLTREYRLLLSSRQKINFKIQQRANLFLSPRDSYPPTS